MTSSTSLVPVRASELMLGKPAPWPIYSDAGDLLLARGTLIETQVQLDGLIEKGLYRNADWVSEPDTESVPLPKARDVLRKKLGGKRPLRPSAAVRGEHRIITPEEVRWQIGDTLWLQPQDDLSARHGVTLIGAIAGKSILVSAPVKEGRHLFLREGRCSWCVPWLASALMPLRRNCSSRSRRRSSTCIFPGRARCAAR